MTLTTTGIEIRPLTAAFGAEVTGIDLSRPLPDEVIEQIRQAWLHYQVLFLPGQHIGPDEQVAFAQRFGELTAPSAVLPSLEGHEEIVAFDNRDEPQRQKKGRHHGWHVDITFQKTPPAGSVFNVVKLPPIGGGTVFASAQASYDSLSEPVRQFIDGLSALHDFGYIDGYPIRGGRRTEWEDQKVDGQQVEHPVVAIHPETGRKGLYVNPGFTRSINGLSSHESDVLLELLFDHTLQPEHVISYRWAEGDVGFWDNRAVWHRRADDFDPAETRIVHRVQLRGTAPVGPQKKG